MNGTLPQPGTICKVDVPLFAPPQDESTATKAKRNADPEAEEREALRQAIETVAKALPMHPRVQRA